MKKERTQQQANWQTALIRDMATSVSGNAIRGDLRDMNTYLKAKERIFEDANVSEEYRQRLEEKVRHAQQDLLIGACLIRSAPGGSYNIDKGLIDYMQAVRASILRKHFGISEEEFDKGRHRILVSENFLTHYDVAKIKQDSDQRSLTGVAEKEGAIIAFEALGEFALAVRQVLKETEALSDEGETTLEQLLPSFFSEEEIVSLRKQVGEQLNYDEPADVMNFQYAAVSKHRELKEMLYFLADEIRVSITEED